MTKKKKRLSLDKAARKLAAIAEKHLSTLPEEEQDSRVDAFARREFKSARGRRTRASESDHTPSFPAVARGR